VTCAHLGENEIVDSSVTIANSIALVDQQQLDIGSWLPHTTKGFEIEQFLVSDDTTEERSSVATGPSIRGINDSSISDAARGAVKRGAMRLFDRKKLEGFLAKREDAVPRPNSSDGQIAIPGRPCQQSELGALSNDGSIEEVSTLAVAGPKDDRESILMPIGACKIPSNGEQIVLDDVPGYLEDRDSMLSMLRSLQNPTLDDQYLETFGACISYILHVWTEATDPGKLKHFNILARLEQSLRQAEVLRSRCHTQLSDVTSIVTPHVLNTNKNGLDVSQRSFEDDLQDLGNVVQEAILLLRRIPSAAQASRVDAASPPELREPATSASKPLYEGRTPRSKHLARSNTPPFLTWAWLGSGFEESIPAPRLAAESLFTIMEDIDRHLRRGDNGCYIGASEATVVELKVKILATKLEFPGELRQWRGSDVAHGVLATELDPIAELSSPSTHINEVAMAHDDKLQSQKLTILLVANEVATIMQEFVALFIPCTYDHSVSNKVWGSLLSLVDVRIACELLDLHSVYN
jgi:hypothetical protein